MTNLTSVGRGRTRARRALLALTTILATGALPAYAQSAPRESPYPNLDANGVDLTDGSFNLRLPVASIGNGDAALAIVALGGAKDNWSEVTAVRTPIVGGSGYVVQVRLGDAFDEFTITAFGVGALSTRGTGASLTMEANSASYLTRDGTIIALSGDLTADENRRQNSNLCSPYDEESCTMLARTITAKSRMVTSYDWTLSTLCQPSPTRGELSDCTITPRLAGVRNEAGYGIGWSYATDTVPNGSLPSPDWRRRTAAALTRDGVTIASVGYATPAPGVTEITTPGGRIWRITEAGGRVTAVRRPGAASDTMVIGYTGGSVSSVVRDGVATGYGYAVTGDQAVMTVTDALGKTLSVESDLTSFRPTRLTDQLGRVTQYGYDGTGRLTEVIAPEGQRVLTDYDARSNVTKVTRRAKPAPGAPQLADLVTEAAYPTSCVDAACNSPVWTKDERGAQTDYTHDPLTGFVTSVTLPAAAPGAVRAQVRYDYAWVASSRQLASISRCRAGAAPACVGTDDETRTLLYYDRLNPIQITTIAGDGSIGATLERGYDARGNLISENGPLAGAADTTHLRWSADRELVGTVAPDPDGAGPLPRRASRTVYRPDGQVHTAEAGVVAGAGDADWAGFVAHQRAESAYDANARRYSDYVLAGGSFVSVAQYGYDALGRLACATVRMTLVETGTPCVAHDAADRITTYGYTDAGEVASTTTAWGTPEASSTSASYTGNGAVSTLTDGRGNVTSYAHDGHHRVVGTRYPSKITPGQSDAGDREQLRYDAVGNVDQVTLRDNRVIGLAHDLLGRVTGKDLPDLPDVTYSYDLTGSLTRAQRSDGHFTAFGHDALGRIASVETLVAGTTGYQYDPAGRRTRMTWLDGFAVDYDYRVTGEVAAIREGGVTAGPGVLAVFDYDAQGRRTSLTRGNGSVTSYGYDAVSRLGSLGHDLAGTAHDVTTSYGYNAASQLTSIMRSNDLYALATPPLGSTSYRNNGQNQLEALTGAGATMVTHDANGNIATIGGVAYGYTAEGRLLTGGSGTVQHDAVGQLLLTTDGTATTVFGHDGPHLVTEGAGGGIARRYVFGPGDDQPLVWYEGAGTSDRRWLHADERGSVVAVSDGTGAAIAVNRYDEYGAPAPGNLGRFGYTGQAWLPEVSLYHYKARMYAPQLGRFLQPDPIGYAAGMNLYGYVGGDPVNRVDPSGMEKNCLVEKTAGCGEDYPNPEVVVTGTRVPGVDIGGGRMFRSFEVAFGQQSAAVGTGLPEVEDIVVTACRYGMFYTGEVCAPLPPQPPEPEPVQSKRELLRC